MRLSYFLRSFHRTSQKFCKNLHKSLYEGDRYVTIKAMMRKVGKFGVVSRISSPAVFFSQAAGNIIKGLGAEASARAQKISFMNSVTAGRYAKETRIL